MKTTMVRTLACVATLAAAGAHAEGLSLGGSLGSSHYNGDAIGGLSTDRSATSGKLYLGWGITPNLGVEAGWADLGRFRSAAGDTRIAGPYLDLVGTWPLADKFSALARLGMFDGKAEQSLAGTDRGTNLKVGLGLQYEMLRNVDLRGEWERYRVDTAPGRSNTDLWSLGVNYRF